MEVSEAGDLANCMTPGALVKGMGGATDPVACMGRVIVVIEHANKARKITRTEPMNPDPAPRKAAAPFLVPAPIGALWIAAIWWVTRPGPLRIRGEVAAPRVDVSARTSGRMAQIGDDLGKPVEAGQTLADLSNTQLATVHAAAASGLEVARAFEAAAGATRPGPVHAQPGRRRRPRPRRADPDEARIFATMPGAISGRMIEQGQNVGPGTPRFTIVDLDQARFSFNLREDLLAGLEIVLPVPYGLPIRGNAGRLLALGLPFFLKSGFAWPVQAIPAHLNAVAQAIPSTTAFDGLVRITQMGATLPEMALILWPLWARRC